MKKVLLFILVSTLLLANLEDVIIPRPPRKGEPDYYETIKSSEILSRKRVKQVINGHSISMPENMRFKKGSQAEGEDKMFGKKRKYLYDDTTGFGNSVYLIEDTIENLSAYKSRFSTDSVSLYEQKNGVYKFRTSNISNGLLIKIKNNLYIACRAYDYTSYTPGEKTPCAAIVKVMKE